MKRVGNVFVFIVVGVFLFYKFGYDKVDSKSHFTITADTNVSKVKGLSKYVTQEEVNDFAFRYWDIDSNYTKNIPSNLIPLRTYLKSKNTNKIIEYIKDNNLSIDVMIQDGTTPLMYSSFYNDVNTSKYLINHKANIHQKDRYGLSPLAYAIENNSTKTAKLLLDSGVRFGEIDKVQAYTHLNSYYGITRIDIDENNNTKIYYDYNDGDKNKQSKDGTYFITYLTYRNFIELLKIVLDSGYEPDINKWQFSSRMPAFTNLKIAVATRKSVFSSLVFKSNYKPLLELLLKYNVYGKPTKEELKRAYDYCHNDFISETKRFNNMMEKRNYDTLNKRGKVGKIIWKSRIDNYGKYCKENNSTFTIRDYFSWANEDEKKDKMLSFIHVSKNIAKVFYIKSNSTKETNTTKHKGINHVSK